jgi:beta-glucosidase
MAFNRPLIVSSIEPHAAAILHCYLPGDYGGDALAQILYGTTNPSGKLPFTYPRHAGEIVL